MARNEMEKFLLLKLKTHLKAAKLEVVFFMYRQCDQMGLFIAVWATLFTLPMAHFSSKSALAIFVPLFSPTF